MRRAVLPALCLLLSAPVAFAVEGADKIEALGQALFFDTALSGNGTQSCASCHDPANGFASATAFPEGAVQGHFGNRKPPSLAYQAISPVLHHRIEDGEALFVGGNMADGRARGGSFGDPAADQALMPILNPDEMGLPHAACLAARACASQGAAMQMASPGVCAMPLDAAATCAAAEQAEASSETLAAVAVVQRALSAYEASSHVVRFSSRYDDYVAGQGDLTADEKAGLALFDGKAQCSACHVLTAHAGRGAVLTDFTYDNLGVPRNPENPRYRATVNGTAWVDRGLAATLEGDPLYAAAAASVEGAVKVPTLRNVWTGQPRAYMHNGWFKTLEGVVRFYNTRDVWPRCAGDVTEAQAMAARCWPAPEIEATMNRDELGNLKLTEAEEAQIVAFLKTLTDR
ncbi:MAG: cytochrome C [Rhodobacteraceae bacterium PARR1]|nr:MAG: cytochrome C [Rhodobacteraceae bacterium PARR1]